MRAGAWLRRRGVRANLAGERGRPRSGGQPGPSTRQAPGGRSRCADPLYPQGGADAFMVDHLSFNRNSLGARFSARIRVFPGHHRPLRTNRRRRPYALRLQGDGTPRCGVPSAVTRHELPGVHSVVVAPGQARHDRSTSGLPARGCPMGSRWPSDSRTSTCLHVYSRSSPKGTLDIARRVGLARVRVPSRRVVAEADSIPKTLPCQAITSVPAPDPASRGERPCV